MNKWKTEKKRQYDTIITSPLKRAKETASIMAKLYNVPIIENEYINELDAGDLCGMDKKEGLLKFPTPSFSTPYDRIAKGTGESEAQLHARALLGIEYILNMKKNSYLIIAHGTILNAILRIMFSIPMPVNRNGIIFKFNNTGYMDLLYDETKHLWIVLNFYNG